MKITDERETQKQKNKQTNKKQRQKRTTEVKSYSERARTE